MKKILVPFLAVFTACTPVRHIPDVEPEIDPFLEISRDGVSAIIHTNSELEGLDSLTALAEGIVDMSLLIDTGLPHLDDTTKGLYATLLSDNIELSNRRRSLTRISKYKAGIQITYDLDTTALFGQFRHVLARYDPAEPIEPLFNRGGIMPDFGIFKPAQLVMPCEGVPIPKRASRLPNAPRTYRSGVHRGIDFFSNWGTPVRSVAEGVIVRSDISYEEVPALFREDILARAAQLERTPSDIFNAILLGQAVFIDHGFNLFPGFRAITIFAHLSHIDPKMIPGYRIKAGEVFGKTGNSGTKPSTLGTRDESHLHWELILQDAHGEYYFGQGLPYEQLYPALKSLFK